MEYCFFLNNLIAHVLGTIVYFFVHGRGQVRITFQMQHQELLLYTKLLLFFCRLWHSREIRLWLVYRGSQGDLKV